MQAANLEGPLVGGEGSLNEGGESRGFSLVGRDPTRHRPNVLQNLPIILFCTAYYFYLLFPFLIPLFL